MTDWIKVTEGLPPNEWDGQSDYVLVVPKYDNVTIAYYDFYRNQWRTPFGEVNTVTHWQPLPQRPMEEKKQ